MPNPRSRFKLYGRKCALDLARQTFFLFQSVSIGEANTFQLKFVSDMKTGSAACGL